MRSTRKTRFAAISLCCLCLLIGWGAAAPSAQAFEAFKTDMTTFDPNNQTFPTEGDTIKIGLFEPFSGPGALSGEIYWMTLGWVVHDINAQGGIMVDGKMKKLQIVKGDTQVKPDVAKRVAEKLILEDKVDVMMGTSGSHINLIGQQVAAKYKKLYMTYGAYSDMLHDKKNFNRYTFRTCWNTGVIGKALAYYYAARPERKFYILCQDYVYGHAFGNGFKTALKQYRPEAEIVGEEYHPLFTKDFAPYLEKIRASGAEVVVSGNWVVDEQNLMKQSRQMGLNIPLAGPFFDDAIPHEIIGGEAGRGMTVVFYHQLSVATPEMEKFIEIWRGTQKNWKEPYNTRLYRYPAGVLGGTVIQYYWLFDVMQRAGSTDPDKIIPVWEGDVYQSPTGPLKMRACDHQSIRNVFVSQTDFPNKWYDDIASYTQSFIVPAAFAMPNIPEGLDRCKDEK